MVEEIKSKAGSIIAIILRREDEPEGINFYTPSIFSQQLGLLNHKKGNKIKPHMHMPRSREVMITQEVLHVNKGKVSITLYDENKKNIATKVLSIGDTILLAGGGHGLEMLEDSLILEVKQGPYTDPSEKEYL